MANNPPLTSLKRRKRCRKMTVSIRALRTIIALTVFLIVISACYVFGQKLLSLPFRETNDLLHKQNSPVTLDFIIPAGIYIDSKMPIKEVFMLRFRKPSNRITSVVEKVSETIPTRYRILGTGILYLFWVTVSLSFFRIVTWMRYATALSAAFLAGAFMYYFMPDLEAGKMDDLAFAGWALCFATALRWHRKRRRNR